MTAVPSLQQASEPSYPDIVLIAINRHGVLLIHPKTKVERRGPARGRPRNRVQAGLWSRLLSILPRCPQHTHTQPSDSAPRPPAPLPTGGAHHLPLHQDLQLEQWQHLLPHGAGEPGPRQPPALRDLTGEPSLPPTQPDQRCWGLGCLPLTLTATLGVAHFAGWITRDQIGLAEAGRGLWGLCGVLACSEVGRGLGQAAAGARLFTALSHSAVAA